MAQYQTSNSQHNFTRQPRQPFNDLTMWKLALLQFSRALQLWAITEQTNKRFYINDVAASSKPQIQYLAISKLADLFIGLCFLIPTVLVLI